MTKKPNSSHFVFVFGSNLAGRHGKGAALTALKHHGAIEGQGIGLQGNSYAIPTKNANLGILPLDIIAYHIDVFCDFVKRNDQYLYFITPVGTGLAGYSVSQIRPLFRKIEGHRNVFWADTWKTKWP